MAGAERTRGHSRHGAAYWSLATAIAWRRTTGLRSCQALSSCSILVASSPNLPRRSPPCGHITVISSCWYAQPPAPDGGHFRACGRCRPGDANIITVAAHGPHRPSGGHNTLHHIAVGVVRATPSTAKSGARHVQLLHTEVDFKASLPKGLL